MRGHLLIAGGAIALVAALVPGAESAGSTQQPGASRSITTTSITVDVRTNLGPVDKRMIGVNHVYIHNGFEAWDTVDDRAKPALVARLKQTHVSVIRFPGGTNANMYRWDQAIGPERGCQVDAKPFRLGVPAAPGAQAFGPDEAMELVDAVGAQSVLMAQFITSSPRDAANWVEYMNSPAGSDGNPNGGVDWADRRAAYGHPAPYNVRLWEIGNEQRNRTERWWMSQDDQTALQQYINGGSATIVDERLGKDCRHPTVGVPSDGSASQVFDMLVPPAVPASTTVKVAGATWRRVDTLSGAGPDDKVYVLFAPRGHVTFGDGVHGAVPPAGALITSSYRSVHQGVFAYISAMKAVDPRIEACTSWGTVAFIKAVKRPYECFTIHSYTNFMREHTNDWASPLEGHDRSMLGCATERALVQGMTSQVPAQTEVGMTEFGLLWGDTETWPDWMDSMSSALYMSSQWMNWLRLGIPWANGNDLVVFNYRGLFSPSPDFDLSPTAIARTAIAPMFDVGGRQLDVHVTGNPIRKPGLGAGTYGGLSAVATFAPHGNLYLMVVNRLPATGIRTTVHLSGFNGGGTMFVRAVTSPSFRSTARSGAVALHTSTRTVGESGFTYTFPAHSITLLRLPSAHGREGR